MAAAPLIGGGLQALGAQKAGSDTADAMDRQAQLQRRNANEAIAAANQNAYKQNLMSAKVMGAADAGYAAAGVSHDSGSVSAVLAASAANAELDRQNILYGGQIRSINYQNQASLDEAAGQNAKNAAFFNSVAALFGGGSKTIANYPSGGGGGRSGGNYDGTGVDASNSDYSGTV